MLIVKYSVRCPVSWVAYKTQNPKDKDQKTQEIDHRRKKKRQRKHEVKHNTKDTQYLKQDIVNKTQDIACWILDTGNRTKQTELAYMIYLVPGGCRVVFSMPAQRARYASSIPIDTPTPIFHHWILWQ